MKNSGGKPRAGAVRKSRKGPQVGSGGQGRQALEGRKPTPKAEDRPYHPAGKAKAARERYVAAGGTGKPGQTGQGRGRGDSAPRGASGAARRAKSGDETEIVTGRNSVLEALRAKIPATTLYIAARDRDGRPGEGDPARSPPAAASPSSRSCAPSSTASPAATPCTRASRSRCRRTSTRTRSTCSTRRIRAGQTPLFVALDGITDPRNLGAIIRSIAAFGGQGVIVPQRRSVGLTASAWKTSAGAAARTPVAMASNLTQTLKAFKEARRLRARPRRRRRRRRCPGLSLADRPVVVVVGSEGKGLSRLVTETCDAVVSIPITRDAPSRSTPASRRASPSTRSRRCARKPRARRERRLARELGQGDAPDAAPRAAQTFAAPVVLVVVGRRRSPASEASTGMLIVSVGGSMTVASSRRWRRMSLM